jgi:hypothetical protein
MPRRSPWILIALILGPFASPRGALAQPAGGAGEVDATVSAAVNVARGMAFYDAGQFKQCAASLASALDDTRAGELDAREVERARVYRGACLVALGDTEGADEQFRKAIRQNPQMATPSTIVFPQEVVDRFILVRSALLDEIRAAQERDARRADVEAERARERAELERRRLVELERLASHERVVHRNRRWVAWVPFGVGQFQNRNPVLGGVFLATETLFAATAVGATSIQLSLHAQAGGSGQLTPEERAQINENLRVAHAVSLVSLGGLLVTAVIGIAEANLSFVPEYDAGTRKRPPAQLRISSPRVAPVVVPHPAGAGLGVRGIF